MATTVNRPEMMSFRNNFLANLPRTLKDVQGKLKSGWELVTPQANPKSELETRAKSMMASGGYESEFLPVEGAKWEGEDYGFMLLRKKSSSSPSNTPKAEAPKNEPTMPAGFFTDVDQSFKGVKKFKPEDNVIISDDNSVIAGDFSNPPKSGIFKDLIESYSSSSKSLTPITFTTLAASGTAEPRGTAREIEQEFAGDPKAHVVKVLVSGTEYSYVAEPVISALRSFPPGTTVKAIVDTNTNPSEPALIITDGSKFIAIGPITVEDASLVTSVRIGVI
jgi:hypothetical protein